MKPQLLILASFITFCMLISCDESTENAFNNASRADSVQKIDQVSKDLVSEVIKSIPSPVEMSTLIKEVEKDYSSSWLNPTTNISRYNSNYKKAVNIGIYGTDLGYINIYNEKQDAILYLNTMTQLAEELRIGHFFDYKTIKRLATNSTNLDSMLYITTSSYDKMNTYLQDQNRGNLSMMMLTGGWLEALYIATEVGLKNKSPDLIEKIGEQKVVLAQIMILLKFYNSDPQVAKLLEKLVKLNVIYDGISIIIVYKEPTVEMINGIPMVTDNSTTEVKITEDDIIKINELVKNVRKDIIS